MKEFKDNVAVITGAASGIGQGLAEKCAKERMKVVIADINEKGLRRNERRLKRIGAEVLYIPTDVSKANDVEHLAQSTIDRFGGVHLLFNNAGLAIPRLTWEYELKDWELVLGVNLWGVIHGIRTFIPIMIEQDRECHIVNTSSIEGILSSGVGGATYGVTKHALVFLSERLALELEEYAPKIKVSVLCPGFVITNIFASAVDRLSEYMKNPNEIFERIDEERRREFLEESPPLTPEQVADMVFQAIREDEFYIFTHKQQIFRDLVKERLDGIMSGFD
jgi:NAD(P)-dependent dehydrogenase (short-subunit alcohol dehydrogenase family)